MFRKNCLVCKSTNLIEMLNLGMHPFADTFIPIERESEPDKLYPLIVDMCGTCYHFQLRTVTAPQERYGEFDYSYTSSNSKASREHWDAYPVKVFKRLPHHVDTVLEIGSNDGYLCEQFKKAGCAVLGVDASSAMVKLAAERGILTHTAIFDDTVNLNATFDLIVANNVFNHANDPMKFVTGVVKHLTPDGTFVFELPYWGQSVLDRKFDQVYHEHVSYFTVTGACNLFTRLGLNVSHVDFVNYHGGSIRVFVSKRPADASVRTFLKREQEDGLFHHSIYRQLGWIMASMRNTFMHRLVQIKRENPDRPIICAGAAAKANTFLNYYRLDGSLVNYVTDASPQKIGKLTPGTRIPIVSDSIVEGMIQPVVIITSWNIAHLIKAQLSKFNKDITFINPFE